MSRSAITDVPVRMFRMLFSFEALYFVVLFSGRIGASYKESALVGHIPLEPTLLAAIATFVVGTFLLWKRDWHLPPRWWVIVAPGLAFTAWAVASAAWSPSEIYVQQKLLEVGLVLTLSIVGGALVIAEDPERVARLAHIMLLFGVAIGLVVIGSFVASGGVGLSTAFGINRLAIARVVGFGSLVALWGLLSDRSGSRWPYAAAFVLTFVPLLMTSSRMPLIAATISIVFVLVVRRARIATAMHMHRIATIVIVISVVIALLGSAAYYASVGQPPIIVERMARLLLNIGNDNSVAARVSWYAPSIDEWLESPIAGQGLASWPLLNDYPDERKYPHSIALETLSETGLVGFVALVAFLGVAATIIIKGLRGEQQDIAVLVGALVIAALLNALVTGDLGDNRFLFGFAALAPVLLAKR